MPKWMKFVVGVLLLPSCAGAALALWRVIRLSGSADITWVPFLAGFICWLIIFYLLPKPMLAYVFGHELTHAVWTWLFGGQVRKFKATSKGGHVVVTKHNFLIGLAPYFFPIYAVIVVAVFAAGHLLFNWSHYLVWFDLLLGLAYAFHVTLTWHALQTRQTDISQQGYLFSTVVIWLGNVMVLLLGIPLLTSKVRLISAVGWWFQETGGVWQRIGRIF